MKAWAMVVVGIGCVLPANAQRVWRVAAGEPVQPVIDGAAPGDRVEIPPHPLSGRVYASFEIQKSLQVVGVSGDVEVAGFRVTSIAAGDVVTVANLELEGNVSVTDCLGVVVLDDLRNRIAGLAGGQLSVQASRHVQVSRGTFASGFFSRGPGAWVRDSTLRAVNCSFGGGFQSGSGFSPPISYPGIDLVRSHVTLVDCRLSGGPGWDTFYDPRCWCWHFQRAGAPAVCGDGELLLVNSNVLSRGRLDRGQPGVEIVGHVRRTMDSTILPIDGPGVSVMPPQPVLSAPYAIDHATRFVVTVQDQPGAIALLFADRIPGSPTDLAPFLFPLVLGPSAALMAVGFTDAAGMATLDAAVPADPAFIHSSLFLQAATAAPDPLRYGISNVHAAVIR